MFTGYKVILTHDDWTLNTERFKNSASINVESYSFSLQQNSIYSLLTISTDSIDTFNELLNTIRNHRRIKKLKILEVKKSRYDVKGKVSIEALFEKSIRSVLSNYEVYYVNEKIFDGKEQWTLVVNGKAKELLSELKNHSFSLYYTKYDIEDILSLQSSLTKKELDILNEAYRLGYFEWPHTMSINDLAEKFGISKTAVLQTLRRAVKKVIRNFVSSYQNLQ